MKYRKKPVVIDAFHLSDLSQKTVHEALNFMGQDIPTFRGFGVEQPFDKYIHLVWDKNGITIYTPSGIVLATVGDYIIKGVNGEFYPCKPDIFEKTYEPAE